MCLQLHADIADTMQYAIEKAHSQVVARFIQTEPPYFLVYNLKSLKAERSK